MSNTAAVDGLRACFERAYGFVTQYVEVCPEEIWAKKFGGWPVWQQLYHALNTFNFFFLDTDEEPRPGLYSAEVAHFENCPDTPPGKADFLAYAGRMKTWIDSRLAGLTDADLGTIHAGMSARMRRFGATQDVSCAQALAMLSGHTLYHLGAADAALREHGLKGVF